MSNQYLSYIEVNYV